MISGESKSGFLKKFFSCFIYIGFFSAPECGGGPDDGKKCVSGGIAPRRPAGRGPGGGPGGLSPVSPVIPGPARRPGGHGDAGSPPSGPALSIAAESWGPVQAAAARRSYFQIFQTFQILFDFRQPGVGLGDQPGVPGYPLWPVLLAGGLLAFPGPALGGSAHAGGAGDVPERCPEVVVIMNEPVLRRGHEIQPAAVSGVGNH